jgi:hypothetical protein
MLRGWQSRPHIDGAMNLELSDTEAEALIQELSGTINYARYPLSPRIQTLREQSSASSDRSRFASTYRR